MQKGADPYNAFNYLVNYNEDHPQLVLSRLNTFVGKAKEHDSGFDFKPEKMTLQTLRNIQQYINTEIDIHFRNIELENPVRDYQHIAEFLSGVDFDQLIEQRIYQEQLFKLTDKRERFDDLSRNLGYGTNNRGGLVKAVLAPVGWAVQAVAVKPVDKELEALRASRVEQITARYLKELGLAGVEDLLPADVATIQNQQIAEENALLQERNAMLLARAVDLASRTL